MASKIMDLCVLPSPKAHSLLLECFILIVGAMAATGIGAGKIDFHRRYGITLVSLGGVVGLVVGLLGLVKGEFKWIVRDLWSLSELLPVYWFVVGLVFLCASVMLLLGVTQALLRTSGRN